MPVHDRLAEPQLGVLGVERQALRAGPQRRCVSPSIWCARAIRANSLRVIESVGAERGQAAREEPQRLAPVLPLDGDRPQVEQDERVVGPVFQFLR